MEHIRCPRRPLLSATQEADFTQPIGRTKGVIGIVAEQLLAVEPACGAIREKPDSETFPPFPGHPSSGGVCQKRASVREALNGHDWDGWGCPDFGKISRKRTLVQPKSLHLKVKETWEPSGPRRCDLRPPVPRRAESCDNAWVPGHRRVTLARER